MCRPFFNLQAADILIRHYCRDDPFLMTCLLDTTTEATRMTTLARSLELSWKEVSSKATRLELPGGINMAYYDLNKVRKGFRFQYKSFVILILILCRTMVIFLIFFIFLVQEVNSSKIHIHPLLPSS